MIVGNPATFAIESHITVVYGELNLLALGYFVIRLQGVQYYYGILQEWSRRFEEERERLPKKTGVWDPQTPGTSF